MIHSQHLTSMYNSVPRKPLSPAKGDNKIETEIQDIKIDGKDDIYLVILVISIVWCICSLPAVHLILHKCKIK